MKKLYVAISFMALLVLTPAAAYSQYVDFNQYLEFNNIGGGARAAGMGGAFIGLAEGEYSYSWNPGAAIFAEKKTIGLQFADASDKLTQPFNLISPDGNTTAVRDIEIKRNHFNLDFGGFSVPFSFMDRYWAISGGYRSVLDLNNKYGYEALRGGNTNYLQEGEVNAASLGVSGKLREGIGIGVTANTYVRGTELNYWNPLSAFPTITPGAPPETVDVSINSTSHYSGVNFDFGLAASFGMFKGGVVVHTPFDLKQDIKETVTLMLRPLPVGFIDRITATTNIPLGYSAGISVAPIEKFTFAVDYDSRPMSKSEITINFESNFQTDFTDDPEWQDLNQFRVGAEYKLDAGFANIPLRVGFRNSPSVKKEWLGNGNDPQYGDQINTNLITFGSGLQFEKAWIDFAYQFGSSSNSARVVWGDVNRSAEIKRDYSRLFVSGGMYF